MNLFILIVLVCSFSESYQVTINLNKLVDGYIQRLNEKTLADGKDKLDLPDINKEWSQKIARIISVKCTFNCHGGSIRNLSTLRRTGDVTLSTSGEKLTLNFQMGLDEFIAHYDSCRFNARRIGRVTNKIDISTSRVSINGQVTLNHENSTCDLSLDHIYINELGDLDFNFGGSVLQKVQAKIFEIFADLFENKVKSAINKNLERQIKRQISEQDLCSKIPLQMK